MNDLKADQREFERSARAYLDTLDLTDLQQARRTGADEALAAERRILQRMGADGWLGVSWPTEYGGMGRSPIEQWLFLEELAHRGLPDGGLTLRSIGPTIGAIGTPEQKAEFLSEVLAGRLTFAIGYSEPNAGSDLASLQLRAVREGNEYVINGQKVWTTNAEKSSHIWLAARTGDPDSRHRGISVLIVPRDSAGLTVRPLYTQADGRTNEVFYDNVRVPVANRVGAENEGWKVIMMALDYERLLPYSGLRHEFEDHVAWLQDHTSALSTNEGFGRLRMAEAAADLDICELFARRAAWMMEDGEPINVESSINKVWLSELRQTIPSLFLDLAGSAAQLRVHQSSAPLDGAVELQYRASSRLRFAAGTNEVQRNIIAQRGLGLPRR